MLEFKTEREKIIYLALTLDTEGSIGLYKDRSENMQRHCKVGYAWCPKISASSTKLKWIRFLKQKFGGGAISADKQLRHLRKGRICNPTYNWTLKKTQMVEFLPKVVPFMICRRKQAELLLEALSIIEKIKGRGRRDNPRLDEIEKELRKLNGLNKPPRTRW